MIRLFALFIVVKVQLMDGGVFRKVPYGCIRRSVPTILDKMICEAGKSKEARLHGIEVSSQLAQKNVYRE